jgi:hypothetical protein
MYGVFQELNEINIFKQIDSFTIFTKYCYGFTKLNKKFHSPLRNDEHPSASIIYYKGDLLFKDFGEYNQRSYRAINFVIRLFNITYREALQKLNCDFKLGLGGQYINDDKPIIFEKLPEHLKTEKDVFLIKIKKRSWSNTDENYWSKRYGISQSTLELFNVHPISNFAINDYLYFSDPLAYSYDYYWEDEVFRRKIYQPFSINKWYNNGGRVVQGEGVLPKQGDLLIITSSLKDVMTLHELGYIAIAPTSESTFVPDMYIYKQQKRFKRIIVFMDSDETGMKANISLSEKWKLGYICIPEQYKTKDISDFVYTYSQNEAKLLLNKLL